MQHPEEGTIHAWLDGALSPDDGAALEAHVAGCAECAARVAEARGFIAASSRILSALDAVPAGVLPDVAPAPGPVVTPPDERVRPLAPRRTWWRSPGLRAAAALLIVAGGAGIVMRQSGKSLESDSGASIARASADSATVAAAPMATPPATPAPVAPQAAMEAVPAPARAPASRARVAQGPAVGETFGAGAAAGAVGGFAGGAAAKSAPAPTPPTDVATLRASQAEAANDALASSAAARDRAQAERVQQRAERAAEPTLVTSGHLTTQRTMADAAAPTPQAALDRLALAPAPRTVPGWTLKASTALDLGDAIVRRSVYEVRPGVEVTLDEGVAAPPAPSEAQAATPQAAPSGAPAARKAVAKAAPAPHANVLRWRSALGTSMALSGALGVGELEALRRQLP